MTLERVCGIISVQSEGSGGGTQTHSNSPPPTPPLFQFPSECKREQFQIKVVWIASFSSQEFAVLSTNGSMWELPYFSSHYSNCWFVFHFFERYANLVTLIARALWLSPKCLFHFNRHSRIRWRCFCL